ncbi:16S rRNA (guanine(527)-N(7))-methyltransferase RsmG [Marinovum sp. 2_MG-2023]|uniref:16S rRNA (guanine(527)-N(7))-methyltransferase RsmG n=1 Tax=unclassified Marinovum TaxID=2647166 RepID=UPI0026E34082|nr:MULTISPECIES: 16S rRNA (guanine(527)-N(7))-methyltransferase RsmG [unclassified Marinovum]MDO6729810.1 16S rRNA (guanine(527)-N(7))-methyltransferase RsmG [Marinovum sp. 2_MG-2023]MDO6779624.1 16S rRNA (guanine(527)-N(7))-methyltransferase RsmG [Marinovum sp. 1_MG-2023]
MINPTPESLNVSRETFDRLEIFVALLRKWSPRINLVSKSTMAQVWERHIADSIQVVEAAGATGEKWVDLGSGGGLPGLVIALSNPDLAVTMVESDLRKSTFLRTVLRETGCKAEVIAERIEAITPQNADVISARALAPLAKLLDFASLHLNPGGFALFPKGVTWKKELKEAESMFSFQHEIVKSRTQEGAVILRIGEISRV